MGYYTVCDVAIAAATATTPLERLIRVRYDYSDAWIAFRYRAYHRLTVEARIGGPKFTSVSGCVLNAPAMDTPNTFDAPGRVQPVAFTGATLQDSSLKAQLPPRSVVVLTLAGS